MTTHQSRRRIMGKHASNGIRSLTILLLIAVLIWVTRFWHSPQFGLYEDDYTRIPQALSMTGSELWKIIVQAFRYFVDHGKPLHPTLIYSLALIGGRIKGLFGVYLIGYLIVTINAFLFYWLIKRISNQTFALISALAYCLYSADTTQAFITHSLGLQPSLTFLLVAMHGYISDKKVLSYILVTGILLNYEAPFLIFLGAPLLKQNWDKRLLKEIALNAVMLGGILISVFLVRYLIGETRVSSLAFPEVITLPITHMIQGPIVAIGMYIYRPIQAIQNLNTEMVLLIAVTFPIFSWVILKSKFSSNENPSPEEVPMDFQNQDEIDRIPKLKFGEWKNQSEFFLPLKLALTGIVMLILAYPLTFTVRAYAISGRDTRVHFGAVIGAALLWASIWYAALSLAQRYRWKKVIAFTLAGVCSLLLGFGLVVQWDYQRAWILQQELWSDIVQFVPDLSDGTVILVDPDGLVDTKHIDANTWSMPTVLDSIYKLPNTWQDAPRVHRLLPDWENRVLVNSLEIKVVDYKWEYVVVPWKDTVLLETSDGRIGGRLEEIQIEGDIYKLKEIETDPGAQYPEGILHDFLISSRK